MNIYMQYEAASVICEGQNKTTNQTDVTRVFCHESRDAYGPCQDSKHDISALHCSNQEYSLKIIRIWPELERIFRNDGLRFMRKVDALFKLY